MTAALAFSPVIRWNELSTAPFTQRAFSLPEFKSPTSRHRPILRQHQRNAPKFTLSCKLKRRGFLSIRFSLVTRVNEPVLVQLIMVARQFFSFLRFRTHANEYWFETILFFGLWISAQRKEKKISVDSDSDSQVQKTVIEIRKTKMFFVFSGREQKIMSYSSESVTEDKRDRFSTLRI